MAHLVFSNFSCRAFFLYSATELMISCCLLYNCLLYNLYLIKRKELRKNEAFFTVRMIAKWYWALPWLQLKKRKNQIYEAKHVFGIRCLNELTLKSICFSLILSLQFLIDSLAVFAGSILRNRCIFPYLYSYSSIAIKLEVHGNATWPPAFLSKHLVT